MKDGETLWNLEPGTRVRIKGIKVTGGIRRRLQDLGLVPGTETECVGRSPLGEPAAYLIRGAVVAIRKTEAEKVQINRQEGIKKQAVIALAGNPNVGKSTVFNALTGMRQHTGNWSGKTVANAEGICRYQEHEYTLVDIPGCYSLMAQSEEERAARDFLCFGKPDAAIVVCDASCLERNLTLVLQIMEVIPKTLICVNLMDEAAKRKVSVDIHKLEDQLGVPVVGTTARSKKGLEELLKRMKELLDGERKDPLRIRYSSPVEKAVSELEPYLKELIPEEPNIRWVSARCLDGDEELYREICHHYKLTYEKMFQLFRRVRQIKETLIRENDGEEIIWEDDIAASYVKRAEVVAAGVWKSEGRACNKRDRMLDRVFTGRWTAFPVMLLLLAGIFWLSITGANYPSQMLSRGFSLLEGQLDVLFAAIGMTAGGRGFLLSGIYRVVTWVIAVMLPPMAIFFPLFTLLEDFGYLPRIAYNMDHCFQKCCACGKQALTMCMGFLYLQIRESKSSDDFSAIWKLKFI